jgi:type I restriction enzyme S subunit
VRTYLENIAQVPEIYDGQIASTGFSVLRANELVLPKYLFYYSLTQNFLEPLNELQRGTSYPAVRDGDVRVQMIPVAPLPEQERIVSRIEELFSDLEAGVAALGRVRAGLKRYKTSVLKAAVEGRLLENRGIESSGELPEGWRWAKWGELVSLAQNGFGKRRSDSGMPTIVLRLADVTDRNISLENVRRVGATQDEIKKYELVENDLICIRVNGSLDNVGRMVLFRKAPETVTFCDHFIRFKLNEPEMAPFYSMYFDTERARKFVELNRVSSAGQNTISQGTLLNFEVPLPPLEEQRRIVAEVERRLSVVGEVESAVEVGLARSARLRQSVLQSAFEGRL